MLLASPPPLLLPRVLPSGPPSTATLLEPVNLPSPNDADVSERSIYGAPVRATPAPCCIAQALRCK